MSSRQPTADSRRRDQEGPEIPAGSRRRSQRLRGAVAVSLAFLAARAAGGQYLAVFVDGRILPVRSVRLLDDGGQVRLELGEGGRIDIPIGRFDRIIEDAVEEKPKPIPHPPVRNRFRRSTAARRPSFRKGDRAFRARGQPPSQARGSRSRGGVGLEPLGSVPGGRPWVDAAHAVGMVRAGRRRSARSGGEPAGRHPPPGQAFGAVRRPVVGPGGVQRRGRDGRAGRGSTALSGDAGLRAEGLGAVLLLAPRCRQRRIATLIVKFRIMSTLLPRGTPVLRRRLFEMGCGGCDEAGRRDSATAPDGGAGRA